MNALNEFKDAKTTVTNNLWGGEMVWDVAYDSEHNELKVKVGWSPKYYHTQYFPIQDDFAPRGIFGNVSSYSTAVTGRSELPLLSIYPATEQLTTHQTAQTIKNSLVQDFSSAKVEKHCHGMMEMTEEETNKKSGWEHAFKREHENDTLF